MKRRNLHNFPLIGVCLTVALIISLLSGEAFANIEELSSSTSTYNTKLGEWLMTHSKYQFRDHRIIEMKRSEVNDISSPIPSSIMNTLIDFKNSTFKSSIHVQGDFMSSCKDRNWNRTFSYFQTPYYADQSNSFVITFWYPYEQYIVTDCMNVRDDYHFCAVSNGTKGIEPTPFCIKMEEKDDKFRIGMNTNFYDCLVDEDFDIEPKCDILAGNVIFVYESPGDKSIMYRNTIAVGVLVVVVGCCCCLIVGILGIYCYLIRRRKRKLLRGSINGQEMNEDEARNLNKW